ncbi:esterase/lipase family protein [Duganella sp. Dugasp56]|uniref:esterase/lipase family protein n=1 Tax=Duganella sp. Dugasp56 TaxID=3243046 RepID=UPI0039B03D10
MATSNKSEPTRPLATPYDDNEGNLRAFVPLSPKANNTRGRLPVPPTKVMPVIVVAGIMGSNLRANTNSADKQNEELKPGEAAWRPPNGTGEGLDEAKKWKSRSPAIRQKILDQNTLEVDPNGPIPLGIASPHFVWDEKLAKERGWGEIHASSYGLLLTTLQQNLNTTYRSVWGNPMLEDSWSQLNVYDRAKWGASKEGIGAALTEEELRKFAQFHYPVYAFGYNWLKSNEFSAEALKIRIESIIEYWKSKRRNCSAVLLVTHSMGGLVARACAKKIPEKVVGIIHGVMPALGAPACYRRLACGTEASSPSNSFIDNVKAEKFAEIAGQTIAETTPVLSTAAGPLELLPNHLYPRPWLFVEVKSTQKKSEVVALPVDDPYALYADFSSWYRMIDPEFADPAQKYEGNLEQIIKAAIAQARKFHMDVLGDYYHPNTFVFYADDKSQLSFGTCRWVALSPPSGFSVGKLNAARPHSYAVGGGRNIEVEKGVIVGFQPAVQDTAGDGTVPAQSGAGPEGKVRQIFRTQGYSHQDGYGNPEMLSLTQHLIVKLMQKV